MLLVAAVAAIALKSQQDIAASWMRHTIAVESLVNRVQSLVADAESGQRGYLITGRASYLDSYDTALRELPPALRSLASETADNRTQQRNVAALDAAIDRKLTELARTVALRRQGDMAAALAIMNQDAGLVSMQKVRTAAEAMRLVERRLYDDRAAQVWITGAMAQAVLVGAAALIVLLAILSLRDAQARLRDLRAANDRLNAEIAERASAEGQVRQLLKVQAIGQLTGGIAHDFNNMLTIVIGSLDLARRRLTGQEAPAVARGIDNAMAGASRAAALTARLLAFSRQQPLEPAVVDANKLVGGMSELLQRAIGESIAIETVLAGGLWKVFADPGQIENAIVNIGVNARDAMPDGGKLTIETHNCDLDDRYARSHAEVTAGQYVLIAVSDTGTGMSTDVIDRAFEPFYTTKGVGQGTGLGLSQVFGFVKQSGGHVKIYSEPGHGTTIKMYFPRHSGAAVVTAPPVERAASVASPGDVILVVEDEAEVRRVSVEALESCGYTVIEAASPEAALAHLAAAPAITLLFTDIVMPGMTGRQLADIALAQRPGLRVLFTTGYTRNAIVHNGMVDPGTNFLAKPFTLDQLADKVRDVLDQPVA
ncbi:CHASE3 domain-containing protein [Polymorphobacter fuscus]|uniref:CHASE3 domain-containing protein n=1 Tax=Sandarakinorhabdus fusca TaxID=1439888 RepID=UPI0016AA3339|nr:CHASE3 domain-containing protein [Polymorphobacter fuscus]NJC07964.1 signal transduction histidine kinase/CheY-like chemotaxis protein [Polymorphobacter fuscus]